MENMRKSQLKYNMLLNRLNGKEIDTVLQGNLKVDGSNRRPTALQNHGQKIRDGLQNDFHCKRMQLDKDIQINKHFVVTVLQHSDTTKSGNAVTSELNKQSKNKDDGEIGGEPDGVAHDQGGNDQYDSSIEANKNREK